MGDATFIIINKKHSSFELIGNSNGAFDINKVYTKEYIGVNTENRTGTQNYTLFKFIDSKHKMKLHFMLYKIQSRHYININNQHLLELDKFLLIKSIISHSDTVCMVNSHIGELVIENCDLDLVNKCISIVEKYRQDNPKTLFDYIEYLFS